MADAPQTVDYSSMSDEELDRIISGGRSSGTSSGAETARAATAAKAVRLEPPATAEQIEPSAIKRGLAAFGGEIQEPFLGAAEKFEMTFPGKGKARETAARISAEREARRNTLRGLEETPAGMVGGILGKGAPLALTATPGGAATLAGGLGFLGGGPDKPTSFVDEMGKSLLEGGIEAGSAWVPAKGLELAGKTVGAATGRLTKEGARAKEIEEAAQRLGLPRPSFGQTYPQSAVASFEKAGPEYSKMVNEQAEALYNVITKEMPYGPEIGGKYLDELKQAVANRYAEGSKMYRGVDDIIANGQAGNFMPNYTANVVTNTKNPGYQIAIEELGNYGFDAASMAGMRANQLAKIPLQFENFNQMRVATNKAWGNINRQIENARATGASPAPELKAAKNYLDDLRTALDNDAERWASQNANNREAVDAYREATKYWKEQVVPTVVENPFARKVQSTRRGFATPERATSLSLSNANIPLVDRLLPTMSRQGADMTEILRTLPEVRATALTGEAAQTPRGPLHAFAQAAEGRRDIGVLEKLAANLPLLSPGLRWTANTTPARRLYGAQDVTRGAPKSALHATVVPYGSESLQEAGHDWLTHRAKH